MNGYSMRDVQCCLNGRLFDNCLGKWFYYPHQLPFVIQIEALASQEVLIYTSVDNSGNGAYLSSFMSLLMIEEINAIPSPARGRSDNQLLTVSGHKGVLPLHQVSGSVSVTYFAMLKCPAGQSAELALIIYEFTEALQIYMPAHLASHDQKCWEARIASLAESKLSQMIGDTSDQ